MDTDDEIMSAGIAQSFNDLGALKKKIYEHRYVKTLANYEKIMSSER